MAASNDVPMDVTTLSISDASVIVVENSFHISETRKSSAGHTVYRVDFKVTSETTKGIPVIKECFIWKRFSDIQNLSKHLELIYNSSTSQKFAFPLLVKANYFDRFKESVIEERRISAETLLLFTSNDINLSCSTPLFNFIEGASVSQVVPLEASQASTESMLGKDQGVQEVTDECDSIPVEEIEKALSDGLIRHNSVTVSQWGLEHNLKLLDENKEVPSEANNATEKMSNAKPSNLTLPIENTEITDLMLPSTPQKTHANGQNKSSGDASDWWHQAVAQSEGIDDYDSLMDNLGEESNHEKQSNLSASSVETDGEERSKSQIPNKSTSPLGSNNGEYIIQAGKLISQGLEFEKTGAIEDSFNLFKTGVDVLLSGVQTDGSVSRREGVRKKIVEYLQYAEILQRKIVKQHQKLAHCRNESGKPHLLPDFKIIKILSSKVLLVQSKHNLQKFVLKVLHKSFTSAEKAKFNGKFPRSKNRSPSQCPFMVKLFHHYETQTNRIFLLLEHVNGGRLVSHVSSIRNCFSKVAKGVAGTVVDQAISQADEKQISDVTDTCQESNGHIEKLLEQLTSIVPPSNPVTASLSTISADSEDDEGDKINVLRKHLKQDSEDDLEDDELDHLKKQLAELAPVKSEPDMLDDTETCPKKEDNAIEDDSCLNVINAPCTDISSDNEEESVLSDLRKQLLEFTTMSVTNVSNSSEIEDSKPAVQDTNKFGTSIEEKNDHSSSGSKLDTDDVWNADTQDCDEQKNNQNVSSISEDKSHDTTLTTGINIVPPTPTTTQPMELANKAIDVVKSSGQSTPHFSPVVSLRNSPEPSSFQEWEVELENSIRKWAAQIVVALEYLHSNGIICRDLYSSNVLLNSEGDIRLTYFGSWDHVPCPLKLKAVHHLYVAPELHGLENLSPAVDFWSLGALLFELLTGKLLKDCHPGGIHSHIPIAIPSPMSPEARSLLKGLLQVNPLERLGSGISGIEDVKAHPFFISINWKNL